MKRVLRLWSLSRQRARMSAAGQGYSRLVLGRSVSRCLLQAKVAWQPWLPISSTTARGWRGTEGFVGGDEAVAVGIVLLEFFGDVGVPLGGIFGHRDLAVAVRVAAREPRV